MRPGSLEGAGIAVIGGTAGVGREIVMKMARLGAAVAFCGRPGDGHVDTNPLTESVPADMRDRMAFFPTDMSNEVEVEHFYDLALEHLPGLDLVVNDMHYATTSLHAPLIDISLSEWNEALSLYLRVPFWISRRAIEEFLANGQRHGRIVHVIYAVADDAMSQPCLASAQSALYSFIRSIAKEYGRREIACNMIVVNDLLGSEQTASAKTKQVERENPSSLHRSQSQAPRVAEVVSFLGSGKASFVNGEALHLFSTR
jgi:3-oxoacyl-[acyl-carrier protein] reductase